MPDNFGVGDMRIVTERLVLRLAAAAQRRTKPEPRRLVGFAIDVEAPTHEKRSVIRNVYGIFVIRLFFLHCGLSLGAILYIFDNRQESHFAS